MERLLINMSAVYFQEPMLLLTKHNFFLPILAMSLALTACVSPNSRTATASQLALSINPLDTAANRPDIFLTGLITGRLQPRGSCLVLIKKDGTVITLLWPGGTVIGGQGEHRIIDLPDNRGSRVIGQDVELTGSGFTTGGDVRLSTSEQKRCPGPYFAVSLAPWYTSS